MDILMEYVSNAWIYFVDQIKNITVTDAADILIVAVLSYYVIRFIRERRAGRLVVGVIFLVVFQIIGELFNMITVKFLMQNIFQVGILAIIVIFQSELRSMLENMGGDSLKGLKSIGEQKDHTIISNMINNICVAVYDLSNEKTGALIVIERTTKLGDVINSGVIINADANSFLLKSIFLNKSPLHDGAVVIRDSRVYAARCLLPLSTTNLSTIKDLGTRHHAAMGMSENSDAVILVVSEETGIISVALQGNIKRNYDYLTLKTELEEILIEKKSVKRKEKGTDNADSDV